MVVIATVARGKSLQTIHKYCGGGSNTLNTVRPSVNTPEIIFGVWISVNPWDVRYPLKSRQTPASTEKMAWLVKVCRATCKGHHAAGTNTSTYVQYTWRPREHQC